MPYGVSQQLVRRGAPVPALSHPPTLPLSGRGESSHAEACMLSVRRGTRTVRDYILPAVQLGTQSATRWASPTIILITPAA